MGGGQHTSAAQSTRYGQDLFGLLHGGLDGPVPADLAAASPSLVGGPSDTPELAHSANHCSARRLSAMTVHRPGTETGKPVVDVVDAVDLRAAAGRSKVGDGAGANADKVGAEVPLS